MTNFTSVKEKVVIVTGAADGLGKAIAETYAANGMLVVLSDVNEQLGQKVVENISESGGEAVFYKANVANEEEIIALVQFAVENYGELDGIVNNAGIAAPNKVLHELSLAEFEAVQNVNFKGVFLGMKYGIEAILKSKSTGGFVINIASLAGLQANSGMSLYTASKHAVVGLTKNAALDYAAHNITVNAICPGTFRTAIWNDAPEEVITSLAKQLSPNGRLGDPTEIANLALFLASDLSRFTNGSIISMDAGASAGKALPLEWENPGILGE
ncbi:SDR family oxidoreductase [Solibacillus sp. A46]|uniref:SDR family oxidoreductase n=1 Tax=Solibacillus faecavium TaxID=2762221 RepID=A0ABR8XW33_9BACL|nr:SDR family NAD(P)-dependent oxidoreductase [Solibacillus faecavium]MBD8036151.1 SDR family oxidoreductase [Solibacillus faecavium]